MNKLNLVFKTEDHTVGIIYRLTLGMVILPHGLQLLLGWFGGPGFSNAMTYFTQSVGLPWLVGFAVILLQSFGALLILVGLGGRLLSVGMIGLFIGMIITAHLEYGFFMNWAGNQKGEGFEFHLLVIGLSLALLWQGSGKYSVDFVLSKYYSS